MPAPAFEFTDRAVPIVQFGRAENRHLGNDRWSRARWGRGAWGGTDWEPVWADTTCEIHEITVTTGRASAADRFVPGTAEIIASNVTGLSTLIFPELASQEFVPVPQPPISNEENLQAPNAATVTSNGWSFNDDFERAGPRWVFPSAWATTGLGPTVPFRIVDEAFTPESHYDSTGQQFVGNGAAQWTAVYDPAGDSEITVDLTVLDWPGSTMSGVPEITVDLLLRSNPTNKECNVARVRFIPVFPGANQVTVQMLHQGPTGSTVATSTLYSYTSGTGTNGVFGPRTIRFSTLAVAVGLVFTIDVSGVTSGLSWTAPTALPGTRVGMTVHYVSGRPTSGVHRNPPRIEQVVGEDFTDSFVRPTGSGWTLPPPFADHGYAEMVAVDGAMMPAQDWSTVRNGQYSGTGMAQWVSEFDGDQFVEFDLTRLAMPYQNLNTTDVEIFTHGNRRSMASMVVDIQYDPSISSDNIIYWRLYQYGPYGEVIDYAPTTGSGEINLGAINGAFPDDRWRVESDLSGEQRLYRNGALLAAVTAPDPAVGTRIGVSLEWQVYDTSFLGPTPGVTPPGARIAQFSGGLREPLGTEELGTWVRVGVHHQTKGNCWFFRGFVDGLVPTYLPERQDAVRIECIDSLGEAGRSRIVDSSLSHRFAEAHTRVHQVLTLAGWPRQKRHVGDDATVMSRPKSGKAIDALSHIAESCGGAVYGDPTSGDVVFWGQDWQSFAPGTGPAAYITNHDPGDEPGTIRVCPVGWEMSQHRHDMATRARFSTYTNADLEDDDDSPIVREWRNTTAEAVYGIELAERTLLCVTPQRLSELINRYLRLRSPRSFPRIEAVLLDAATADEALDLMSTAQFTRPPSRYQCQLRRGGEWVFNRQYLVTGIRHRITPTKWTCRLQLDIASAFTARGGRWGRARWNQPDATWGRTR